MKPISLKFQAFGPYVEEQYVDFEALEKCGLFLICGETGSGKTTILDAITYALYGKSSGGGRGDIETMRCNQAPKETDTKIEFEFEASGKRYLFTRVIKLGRKNLTTTQNSMVYRDGIYVPLHENTTATIIDGTAKVPGDAENIIGLSYEQFRQVIILPQGQFEKLLTSDSAEKEKILVSIFHAEKWQQIGEAVYANARAAVDNLKAEQDDIMRRLGDYNCSSLQEMEILLEEKKETLLENKKMLTEKTKSLEEKRAAFEQKKEVLGQFIVLDEARLFYENLRKKDNEIARMIEELKQSEIVERIKPEIEKEKEAKSECELRRQQLEQARKQEETCRIASQNAESSWAEHQAQKPRIDMLQKKITQYEELTQTYQQLEQVRPELTLAKEAAGKAKWELGEKESEYTRLGQELLLLQEKQQKISEEHQKLYKLYIENISGTLAQKLVENEPCPVCGSRLHPSPAVQGAQAVSDENIRILEERESTVLEQIRVKRGQRDKAEEEKESAVKREAMAQNNLVTLETRYDFLLSKKDKDIADFTALKRKMNENRDQILGYEANGEKLSAAMQLAKGNTSAAIEALTQKKEELQKAENSLKNATEAMDEALKKHHIEAGSQIPEALLEQTEKETRQNSIASHKARKEQLEKQILELEKQLQNQEKPDVQQLQHLIEAQDEMKSTLLQKEAVLQDEIEKLEKLAMDLKKRLQKYEKESVSARENFVFARQLRGDTGIGLQRYVLGVMLSAITSEANRLLENVHGGRYRLYRTDQTTDGARKAGLELEVRDGNANGESRSVRGLSGGEKFLVALSLSIGLSTVAQKKGMKLEAMFIDEGFGSLDQKSIGDALDVLAHIQKSNGLVGIISHVQILKDNIPTHIEIVKTNAGSRLDVKI